MLTISPALTCSSLLPASIPPHLFQMPDAVAELASSIPLSTSLRRTQTETFPPPESINASYSPSAIQRGFSTGEQFPPFLLQVNIAFTVGALTNWKLRGRCKPPKYWDKSFHCADETHYDSFPPLVQDLPSPPPLWVLRLKGPIVIRFSYTNNTKVRLLPHFATAPVPPDILLSWIHACSFRHAGGVF